MFSPARTTWTHVFTIDEFTHAAALRLQGKAYDAKADIWSAGCILHELAGLKKTFEAPSLATMYSRIMEWVPRLPVSVRVTTAT
jgi:serine/threonine protein kinase